MIRLLTAGAILTALLLVLLGRIIPLPTLVTGEEGSRTSLVTERTTAVTARYKFQQATLDYQHYLATHPLSILPDELRKEAADLDAGAARATVLDMARSRMARILDLGQAMSPYAEAGDAFFADLQAYDNDLMSWSRTLGPRSEELRRSTWPILEWLKRYPPPLGENYELMFIPASTGSPLAGDGTQYPLAPKVLATAVALSLNVPTVKTPPTLSTTMSLLERLAPQLAAPDASSATIRQVALAADGLWLAGRYIPPVDSFHDGYFSALRRYDGESLEVAATPDALQGGGVPIVAWGGGILLSGVLLGALLLIFAPPAFWRRVPLLRDHLAPLGEATQGTP